jgi:hypothetical protein
VFPEEAVDLGVQVGDGPKDAALGPAFVGVAKKPSTALSQEADVGVKWNVGDGVRANVEHLLANFMSFATIAIWVK